MWEEKEFLPTHRFFFQEGNTSYEGEALNTFLTLAAEKLRVRGEPFLVEKAVLCPQVNIESMAEFREAEPAFHGNMKRLFGTKQR